MDSGGKTDGVIIDVSATSMFVWPVPRVRWREAPPREQGSGGAAPGVSFGV